MGRENHTKPRSVRVPDDLWKAAGEAAAADGCTVTDVITAALRRYVKSRKLTPPPPAPPHR